MLARGDLDAIFIANPPFRHGPDALAALDAGKHAFVEKPLATNVDQGAIVLAKAALHDRVVGIDYPMPHTAVVRALHAIAGSGVGGPLLRVAVENVASCEGLADDHWFWNPASSGGILVEHGVHFFDWCGSLLGAPELVWGWSAHNGTREDRAFAAVSHAGGALATYYHAFVATSASERTRASLAFDTLDVEVEGWIPNVLRLSGPSAKDAATVVRNLGEPVLKDIAAGGGRFAFDAGPKALAYASGVQDAARDFARAALDRSHARLVDDRRALESLRVADAARRAAAVGVPQRIP